MNTKNLFKVIILGCGNIGIRHLQGVSRLKKPIEIYVCDTNIKSLTNVKKKINKIKFISSLVNINYIHSLDLLKKDIDLAIISTSSYKRYNIIKNLVKKINIKFLIIEKFAFQSIYEFKKSIDLLKINKIKAWVNCPRRTYKDYQNLKQKYIFSDETIMVVDGSNWLFASNLVHFVDLFAYLFNDTNLKIISDNFSSNITSSKRKNYIDFCGNIILKNSKNNILIVNEDKNIKKPFVISIINSKLIIQIYQNSNIAIIQTKQNNWKKVKFSFKLEKQSELTTQYINKLILTKKCDLVNIDKSFEIHKIILQSFNKHLSKTFNKVVRVCPIT